MGMGRAPGNLPIELVADYRNETGHCHYDLDEIMDAIQDHIAPIKGESAWGYTPALLPVGPVQPPPQLRRTSAEQG